MTPLSPLQPGRARPSLPDLPIELLKTIIQDVKDGAEDDNGESDWELELRALSLVSKSLTAPCQAALFEVADMEPPKFRFGKDIYRGSDTLTAFPQLIKTSPHLGSYIRHLTITFPLDPKSKISGERADEMADALKHVTNLTGLSIQHEDETYCKGWAISIPEMRANPQLGRLGVALAGLLGSNLQHLLLVNVTVSVVDLRRCTSLEGLRLLNANLAENPNVGEVEAAGQLRGEKIQLRSLEITGKSSLANIIDTQLMKHRPLFDFSRLEDLTIPLRSGEGPDKELSEHILPHTPQLRLLFLHAGDPYAVSPEDNGPSPNALAHLHPACFSTLIHLALSIEFDLTDVDAVIRDPYRGHFANGSILRLAALETLDVLVWIGGVEVRSIDIHQSCGPQWGVLDRALTPGSSEGKGRLSKLKSVRVLFGRVDDDPDIPPPHTFNEAVRVGLRRWFPRLKELEGKGEMEFVVNSEMRLRRI